MTATPTEQIDARTTQLKGLEGARVEVSTLEGETRRFIVGSSAGRVRISLELANRRSRFGSAAAPSYVSVRLICWVRRP
jgi:hypothetical protein